MKKFFRTALCFTVAAISTVIGGVACAAADNVAYSTYSYNYDGEAIESPHAYVPDAVYSMSGFGIGDLDSPSDLCTDKAGNIYISDTGNARVVIVPADFSAAYVIGSSFDYNGETHTFSEPSGVFATDDGTLYVADSKTLNIYIFSNERKCVNIIEPPTSSLLPSDFSYIPSKISVDKAGRIFIVSSGNTYGVVALDSNGEYSTFIGAQKTTLSLWDKIWRRFMTEEQKKRTVNNIPTNYNNIAIDEKGFLYVTATYSNTSAVVNAIMSRSTDNTYAMIKKLNSSGEDVLLRNGFFPPCGDVEITVSSEGNASDADINYGPSSITDVAVGKNGVYSLMDSKRGKIFTYNSDGDLLYAFGNTGYQDGLFRQLASIAYGADDSIIALDSTGNTVTVFRTTEYGKLIAKAIDLSENRKYEESIDIYEQILLENANYDLANIGIGTAMMRKGDYERAMYYFKLANDVDNYSEAYTNYRKALVGNYILLLPVIAVIIFVAISFFLKKVKAYNLSVAQGYSDKRSFKEEFLYVFYVIFHPFDGFWELKRSKHGSVRAASVILGITIAAILLRQLATGYICTGKTTNDTNIFISIAVILAVVAVWCISNRCLTSLMYGEGNFKDIYVASCYALMPLPIFMIPATIISNFVTQEEIMFVSFINAIGFLWVALLLFVAVLSTHGYQLGSNVITVILTLVGMIVIVFLMLLFVNLIGQMWSMIKNIYNEVVFRL